MYGRVKRLYSIYVAVHAGTGDETFVMRLRLFPGFAFCAVRAFPHAVRWAKTRDPAARARVKQILDLSGPAPIAMDTRILECGDGAAQDDSSAMTIVMPVYGNLEMTLEALSRVAKHTTVKWRMVLVDDCSPTPDVRPALRRFARGQAGRVELIELDENQGFVGAVNTGLKRAVQWDDPVVILNTDAFVPSGWAERLLAPIWQDATVASVTPLSNDAELGCVPAISAPRDISTDAADRLDRHASTLNGDHLRITAPAGVGYCMAMSARFLKLEPQFDPVFAPGYGEEVDWCQKVEKHGGVHVYVPNLFVAHMGGQSFGSEAKRKLIARNSEVLSRRYPRFDARVVGFVRNDPLVTARLSLGLAWVAQDHAPVTIYIAHSMGGGAEIDLARKLRDDVAARGAAVVIRFGGVFRFYVELWWEGDALPVAAGTDEWDDVLALLRPVSARHVNYSNAVGDVDPSQIPELIESLLDGEHADLSIVLHDFFPLSPSHTLLGEGDRFIWPLDPLDKRHQSRKAGGGVVSLEHWQAGWRRLMCRATQVVCFSELSRDLLMQVYPDACNVVCNPHRLPVDVPMVVSTGEKPTIGVLGNISQHKGADIVLSMSRALGRTSDVRMVLLGSIDPAYTLAKSCQIHGAFDPAEIADLAERYGITCWLIPSIWPETFSFTTHEAIATGLPVIVFDLGAQADAVRNSVVSGGQGAVLPLGDGAQRSVEDIIQAAVSFQTGT